MTRLTPEAQAAIDGATAKQPADADVHNADFYYARSIRGRLVQLREAITDARAGGLTVEVPELVHLYLDGGTASGSPSDWKIARTVP